MYDPPDLDRLRTILSDDNAELYASLGSLCANLGTAYQHFDDVLCELLENQDEAKLQEEHRTTRIWSAGLQAAERFFWDGHRGLGLHYLRQVAPYALMGTTLLRFRASGLPISPAALTCLIYLGTSVDYLREEFLNSRSPHPGRRVAERRLATLRKEVIELVREAVTNADKYGDDDLMDLWEGGDGATHELARPLHRYADACAAYFLLPDHPSKAPPPPS